MFFHGFHYKSVSNLASSAQRTAQYDVDGQLIYLTYEDSGNIRVRSSASYVDVILPNYEITRVTSTGYTCAVSGVPDTLYYVYITYENGVVFSTTAPDSTYTKCKTLGEDKVLIGYMGFSATNTIAGTWNVFSWYGEPERQWTANINTCSNPSAGVPGLVIPPGKSASLSRTGTSIATVTGSCSSCGSLGYLSYALTTGSVNTASFSTGYGGIGHCPGYISQGVYWIVTDSNCTKGWSWGPDYWIVYQSAPTISASVGFASNTLSQGVYANVTLNHSATCTAQNSHGGYYHSPSSCGFTSCSGTIVCTRGAS